jgi:hypothetical protein
MNLIQSFGPTLPLVLMVLGVLVSSVILALVALLSDY